jgi:serine/threonine-protein kinase
MLAIVREEPMPITRLRADLPPQLDDLVGWSMAKDVERRFKSIYAFAHALKPFAGPEGHLLVDRIGAIAHQQGARLAARVTPPSYDGPDLNDAVEISATSLEDEHDPYMDDDATAVLDSSGLQHLAREITDNMGNVVPGSGLPGSSGRGGVSYGGAPGSHAAGPLPYAPTPGSLAARGISVPPPTPSIPPSPFPAHLARSSPIAPRITSMDGGPTGLPGVRPETVAPATLMSFGPGSRSGKAKPTRDLRIVWGGLAAMAVMLPVIVLLLSRGPREPAADGPIAVGASAPAGAPPKMAEPASPAPVRAPS